MAASPSCLGGPHACTAAGFLDVPPIAPRYPACARALLVQFTRRRLVDNLSIGFIFYDSLAEALSPPEYGRGMDR